jgi:hypothetical protein
MLRCDAQIDAVADSNASSHIAFQLRHLFQVQSQDEDVLCRDSQGGMSVTEKMDLWASKPLDLETTPADSERFEGVSDDPDYGRKILQSKAYEWFIQRLLKESSFYWGHGPPMKIVREIRHNILSSLPAARISRRRDPDIHRVEFIIPPSQLGRRLLWESRKWAATAWDWKDLSTITVLVGSPDDCLLATSVGEYIDQTWGDNRELLREFQAALERVPNSGRRHSRYGAPS